MFGRVRRQFGEDGCTRDRVKFSELVFYALDRGIGCLVFPSQIKGKRDQAHASHHKKKSANDSLSMGHR